MYDYSFSYSKLRQCLKEHDFVDFPKLRKNKFSLSRSLWRASKHADERLSNLSLEKSAGPGGKPVYQVSNFDQKIVLRKLKKNIIFCHPRFPINREQSLRKVRALLKEPYPYRIYRIDIKSFYESFRDSDVLEHLKLKTNLDQKSVNMLENIFHEHKRNGGEGLPRGLPISHALAEMMMYQFDAEVRNCDGVYFYTRYVDDILIITNGDEGHRAFCRFMRSKLPSGLRFNSGKSTIKQCKNQVSPNKATKYFLMEVEYLGYDIQVWEPQKKKNTSKPDYEREVLVDISDKKIKKIKTRITLSFLEFLRDGDYALLKDRLKYLSSNVNIYDRKRLKAFKSGIYYSYLDINVVDTKIKTLDVFIRGFLNGSKAKDSVKVSRVLDASQKEQLMKLSFYDGFCTKRFFHFGGARLKEIQRCWKYAK